MASLMFFLCFSALITFSYSIPHPQIRTPSRGKAVYFLDNEVQNSIVALRVNSNGTLSDGSITATGGAGGVAIHPNGPLDVPDVLFSSGSVVVSEDVSQVYNKPR